LIDSIDGWRNAKKRTTMQTLHSPNSYFNAATRAAGANAWRVAHKIGLSAEERQDVEHDILLELLERESRYDASRGQPGTFTGLVSQHRAGELTSAIVHDRQHMLFRSSGEDAANECDSDCLDVLADANRVAPLWGEPPRGYDEIHVARDLDYAVSLMDAEQRVLLGLLTENQDMPMACKASGLSKPTFYRRVADLQMHLRMFGIKAAA
jgi:hypothetical protein